MADLGTIEPINFKRLYYTNQNLISQLCRVKESNFQMELGVQFEYSPGIFWDRLAEAHSGTHDTLNSFI